MNALHGINFGFSVQLGDMLNDTTTQNSNTSETGNNQGTNSFLSILNLLDVNADEKIDTEELKFGSGFMINSLIQTQDQDGDLLLSADEAGVSPGTVSLLDADSDQNLSAGEMITAANKIIEGLVPLLDVDGDSTLSREELAIFELLFSGNTHQSPRNEGGRVTPEQAAEAYQPVEPESETAGLNKNLVSLQA